MKKISDAGKLDSMLGMGAGPGYPEGDEDESAGEAKDESAELDPTFASEIADVFPDLDDDKLLGLQRAIKALTGMG